MEGVARSPRPLQISVVAVPAPSPLPSCHVKVKRHAPLTRSKININPSVEAEQNSFLSENLRWGRKGGCTHLEWGGGWQVVRLCEGPLLEAPWSLIHRGGCRQSPGCGERSLEPKYHGNKSRVGSVSQCCRGMPSILITGFFQIRLHYKD